MAEKLEAAFLHEERPSSDAPPEQTPEQKVEAKHLLRRIDLLILPLCVINYFFSSMDCSDIGNAKVAGFTTDNNLSSIQFSTIVSTFHAGYVIFQPIGALSIRLIPPYILLGCANVAWGICTCLMALSTSILLPSILRVLVGAAEGLTEVNVLFLTLWYTHEEYAVRTGIWYSSGVLAGSFNGLIAYGIQSHESGRLKSWQALLLVEACLPIAFGLVMVWLYPPVPEKVKKFFTTEEKLMIVERTRAARNTPGAPITLTGCLQAFAQPQAYAMWLIYFCVIWTISGYNNFVPSIIHGHGYSTVDSQLLTVPLSVLGSCPSMLSATSAKKRRSGERSCWRCRE
jgi:MFS family permease